MFVHDNSHHDPWVKKMIKANEISDLIELIQKRIEYPGSNGPWISHSKKENPTDIISKMANEDEEFRDKIGPPIGFMLYDIIQKTKNESHEILRGIFSIIKNARLINCDRLLFSWLKMRFPIIVSDNATDKETYRDGMLAFSFVQRVSKEIEEYWFNIWRAGDPYWWPAAFLGLREQNPSFSCKEMPLLMLRNIDVAPYLLEGIWNNKNARVDMENNLKDGLDKNSGWAGLAIHHLSTRLTDEQKKDLIIGIGLS